MPVIFANTIYLFGKMQTFGERVKPVFLFRLTMKMNDHSVLVHRLPLKQMIENASVKGRPAFDLRVTKIKRRT